MPISIPVIDMVEIGAGGGSLAHVDSMSQIRVGPESAGSEPGPACYGRGGERPAVTDADLILGKLDANHFAGGSITLEPENSKQALLEHLGSALAMDAETAAFGLSEVVDENMANAARVHAVENGKDLSQYTMIAFGGAAPSHAGRLCEKLGVSRLLVPVGAGVGSAIGFLRAPFSFEANRSVYMKLSNFDADAIQNLLADLEQEAKSFVRSCDAAAEILSEFKVYMRYTGQGWEIPISLSAEQAKNPSAKLFQDLFEQDYINLFGRKVDGMDIEITVWAVNATTRSEAVDLIQPVDKITAAKVLGERRLFDPTLGEYAKASVVMRETMEVGHSISGPAIISESETTIIIPSSRFAIKQVDGCIDVSSKAEATQ